MDGKEDELMVEDSGPSILITLIMLPDKILSIKYMFKEVTTFAMLEISVKFGSFVIIFKIPYLYFIYYLFRMRVTRAIFIRIRSLSL